MRPRTARRSTVDAEELHSDAAIAARVREARLSALLGEEVHRGHADELSELLERVGQVYAQAIREETRATYARRWRMFAQWCDGKGLQSLPAAPETVMLYISQHIADEGVALSTMRGWAAAINRVHIDAGYLPPGQDPTMTLFLRGLSRLKPTRRQSDPVQALRISLLRQVCHSIDAGKFDPIEIRDRAILGLHADDIGDGEMRRLIWGDIRFGPRGIQVTLRPVGSQRVTRVRRIGRRRDPAVCPVTALLAWKEVMKPADDGDPVFALVVGGRVMATPMRDRRIFSIRHSRLGSLGTGAAKATPEAAMKLLGVHQPLAARDKAILLLGFAGAFRRKEITDLRWSDVTVTESGLVVHLRRSKTDQEGRGTDVGIPYGKNPLTCPVRAFNAWKQRVEAQADLDPEGWIFVPVGRAGRISTRPLSPEAVTKMVRTRAAAAGLSGNWGGRSLRAGFISTAADLDIPLEKIAGQSRHATLDCLILYVRRDDPFRRNPAAAVGL